MLDFIITSDTVVVKGFCVLSRKKTKFVGAYKHIVIILSILLFDIRFPGILSRAPHISDKRFLYCYV